MLEASANRLREVRISPLSPSLSLSLSLLSVFSQLCGKEYAASVFFRDVPRRISDDMVSDRESTCVLPLQGRREI